MFTHVEGKVVLDNGDTVEFIVYEDGTYSQWGAPVALLGQTVDLMLAMASAVRAVSSGEQF